MYDEGLVIIKSLQYCKLFIYALTLEMKGHAGFLCKFGGTKCQPPNLKKKETIHQTDAVIVLV